MNVLFTVVGHLLHVIAKLMRPGGTRTLIAENLLLKKQMIVLNRGGRGRALNVPSFQKLILEFLSSLIPKRRLTKASASLKASTLFKLHQLFVNRKYRDLLSAKQKKKPRPKGPERELIDAVVEFKKRNPRCGYIRIAQQLSITFDVEIDQDVVHLIGLVRICGGGARETSPLYPDHAQRNHHLKGTLLDSHT